MAALGAHQLLLLGIALTVLVFFTHRANIDRLRAGTEPKFGGKK
jgi:glycerol-3-phosphate acyltransferase PlsY